MVKVRVIGAVALCVALAACGSDSEEDAKAQTAVTGEFVGKATAEDAYVAIYTSNTRANGEFDVVAYVCNKQVPLVGSQALSEWFTGTGRNNTVDLKSQAGTTHLKATLTPGRASGTIELPGGGSATFEATASTDGPAGLFEVTVDDQGNLVGTSRGGKTMRLSPFLRDGDPGYQGTISSANGASVPYELFVQSGVVTKQDIVGKSPRTIILPDGTSRGVLDPIPGKTKGTTR